MDEQSDGLKVYFNPFAFTDEQNNEFLRLGYEVMPITIPNNPPQPRSNPTNDQHSSR